MGNGYRSALEGSDGRAVVSVIAINSTAGGHRMWKRQTNLASPLMKIASEPRKANRWHSVSVVSKGYCCEASTDLSGRRFLSQDAPRLPLAKCTKGSDCRCSYQHHEDRRSEPRRRQDVGGLWLEQYHGNERRTVRGRRATDAPLNNDWHG